MISIIIIIIPLYFSFISIKNNAELSRKIDYILAENVPDVFYDYDLSDIYLKKGEKHIDIVLKLQKWMDWDTAISELKKQLEIILKDTKVISTLELKYLDVF